jgi:glycosyltransferase involved in cell wall biosynthesis
VNVLYFINQYPKVSHTFIRREILALEKLKVSVFRVAARKSPEQLLDELDIAEQKKTLYLVAGRELELIKDIFWLAFSRPGKFISGLREAISLSIMANFRFIRHFAYLAEAISLLRLSEENNIHHIHAHFGTNPASVVMLCRIIGGPKYSFTLHGPEEFDHPLALSLEKKINNADFVAAITSYCRSQLFRWCNWSQWGKIKELHCGVDPSLFEEAVKPIGKVGRFLSIGRLCEQKGQMLLLDAIHQLKQQSVFVELVLIGDGELRDELEWFITEHGLFDRVTLLGWCSGEEIKQALDDCSVFVLPSFAEGLPVVIMEALARARPVLTTYIAGIPELVVDGESGWLVPAGSAEALANKMKAVAQLDAQVLLSMGLKGQQAVMERHNAELEAEKMLQFMNISNNK